MMPLVPPSLEVSLHHADQHPCPDAKCHQRICPCGRTVAFCCTVCGEPVLAAAARDVPYCEHMLELVGEVVR